MVHDYRNWLTGAVACGALLLSAPLAANVLDGVDAWSRGDYSTAVAEWEEPAAAGDPDAMFNLGQAYRLGRGVPRDLAQAETLYARAAEAGHVQAADTYGLMLFQDGRREQALPYVESAARRGDPRSQYLLGIAHFNGDLVPRDWERAYALLTLANAEGLPQAAAAIAQMDEHIPLAQRQQAAGLAQHMLADAERARAVELAQADLGAIPAIRSTTINAGSASPRVPRPIPTTAVSPSVAAARAAVAEARTATGTEDPAAAGVSYAQASASPSPQIATVAPRVAGTAPVRRPAPVAPVAPAVAASSPTSTPSPAPVAGPAARPAVAPAPAPQPSGPWRVQLGAFSVSGNAERLWASLSGRRELAGRERLLIPSGRVTRLLAGGYATQAAAQGACQSLKSGGHDCLVTRN